MGIKITDNIKDFVRNNASAMDRALNRMAIDVERQSKAQVPHDKGQLKASGHFTRLGLLKYKVQYNSEYARFQEFGGDDKRKVLHYSKAGKKKFYLRDAGKTIAARAIDYIKGEIGLI